MRKAELVDQLSAQAATREIPGANFSLTQPIIDNVTEAVTGSPADLAVIISGPDLQRLRALGGADARRCSRQIPGAADTLSGAGGRAGATAHPDRPAGVARYGINVRDVQDVIEMAIGGQADQHRLRRREALRHHGALTQEQARADAAAIGNILVPTHDGGRVPLSQLARHRGGQRREHHRAPRESSGRSPCAPTFAGATRAAS